MDQTIINWLLAGFGALIGFLLNAVWQAVKDLQAADKALADKVGNIEVLVVGDYLRRDDFTRTECLKTKSPTSNDGAFRAIIERYFLGVRPRLSQQLQRIPLSR